MLSLKRAVMQASGVTTMEKAGTGIRAFLQISYTNVVKTILAVKH
jgi:hypothetical protein